MRPRGPAPARQRPSGRRGLGMARSRSLEQRVRHIDLLLYGEESTTITAHPTPPPAYGVLTVISQRPAISPSLGLPPSQKSVLVSAVEPIVPSTPIQLICAAPTTDHIIPTATFDNIVAPAPLDDVPARRASDNVIAGRAHNGGGQALACDRGARARPATPGRPEAGRSRWQSQSRACACPRRYSPGWYTGSRVTGSGWPANIKAATAAACGAEAEVPKKFG